MRKISLTSRTCGFAFVTGEKKTAIAIFIEHRTRHCETCILNNSNLLNGQHVTRATWAPAGFPVSETVGI